MSEESISPRIKMRRKIEGEKEQLGERGDFEDGEFCGRKELRGRDRKTGEFSLYLSKDSPTGNLMGLGVEESVCVEEWD